MISENKKDININNDNYYKNINNKSLKYLFLHK